MRLSACKLHSAPEESDLKRDSRRKSCSPCRSAASERYRVLKGPDEQHQRWRSQRKQCGGNSFWSTSGRGIGVKLQVLEDKKTTAEGKKETD